MTDTSQARLAALPHFASGAGTLAAIVVFAAIVPTVLLVAPAVAAQLAMQLHLGPAEIGRLFSAELGAMSAATLPAYYWLPRFDWRRAALVAALVFIGANLVSALVPGYAALLALRVLSALAGGSLMILCLSAAAMTPNPDRVYGFWVMGQLVLGAVGLAVLPTLFDRYGIAVCYLGLAGLMALSSPLVRYLPAAPAPRVAAASANVAATDFVLPAGIGIAAVLTFYISLSGVWTFVGAIAAKAAISPQTSGNILAIATLLGVVGAASASAIGNRLRRVWVLLAGYALMIGAVALLIGTPDTLRFTLATFGFKIAWTFVLPFILASLAGIDRSGRLMSTTNLVIGGGLAIGPALAGSLIEASGGEFQPLLLTAVAVAVLSLGLILALQRWATASANL
ncbi:MFS transporter [Pseudogulbenkiania ferrooxidans]|uniref:Major facilitator superfamily MFS_1 n=1 Tax=Pseudogulbenkiania ferrooxidans 2002 TaxID=279714 RepID=B9Z413_9NEIS|nr:MFS transporter [Pseudogulbenkiania ferrooxidans]EEG08590.1 major facilitator superfamily MFS_1 [Pseudogulbenkiania ferrooxidans 2002]